MSKVDMKVFEEVKASSGYTSMTEMVYNMCEGDFYPTTDAMLECPYPDYKLKSTDLEEYNKQYEEYEKNF